MVGVNSSYITIQNDVVFGLRVSRCRRFTVYPYFVVFPSRRLHPPVHVYQSNGSYFMLSLLLMSSSRYIFYFIVSLPIFFSAFVPFSDLRYAPVLLCTFLPQDVMFFLFVFQSFTGLLLKASGFLCTGLLLKASGTLCTGLLLKASGILSTGLRKMKLYSMPFSTHILLVSLWRKLIRKICVEKSMKLSGVSFPGISLEDSLSILGTNILSFSQGDRSLAETIWFSLYSFPEDAMFFLLLFQAFGIFYLFSASFRFCSTGLLLKPSGFLYMRTETMSLSDVSFSGISLEDSPRIVGTNIVFFSQGEDLLFFFFFPFFFFFLTRQVVYCIYYVLFRFGFVADVWS
ncbi:hypothetical protein LXL04_033897 [Taraxacum kok-saghyz]